MAKENTVILYGYIENQPIIRKKEEKLQYARFNLTTLRRSYSDENLNPRGRNRKDKLTVFLRNEYLLNKLWRYMEKHSDDPDILCNSMVFIRGTVSTKWFERRLVCPHCREPSLNDYFLTYVDPVSIDFFPLEGGQDKDELLKSHIEFSNLLFLWGTICVEPAIYPSPYEMMMNPEQKPRRECEFQVASNRKRIILEDTAEDTSDYPWVKIYGEAAVQAYEERKLGDELYIHGCLQGRDVRNEHICPYCEQEIITEDHITEIVPYQIMDGKSALKENTILLYGKVTEANDEQIRYDMDTEGNVQSIRFHVITTRRFFDQKLGVFRGEKFDMPEVCISNPHLIKKFIQEKYEDPSFSFSSHMVMIKGVLCTRDREQKAICKGCGEEYIRKTPHAYVDVIDYFLWENCQNNQMAGRYLKNHYSFSNLAFIHGTLPDFPVLYPNTQGFIAPKHRKCDFSLQSRRTRKKEEVLDNPQIHIYGGKSVEAYEALQKDSEIYIYGGMEARKASVYGKCPSCAKITEADTYVSGVIPYSIEYVENCVKPLSTHIDDDYDDYDEDIDEALEEGEDADE